jgi:hypothetical protein
MPRLPQPRAGRMPRILPLHSPPDCELQEQQQPTTHLRTTSCPGGPTRLQLHRTSAQLRTTSCPGGPTRLQLHRTSAQRRTTSCPGGPTRLQLHRTTLRIFTDRLPRHPNAKGRPPTPQLLTIRLPPHGLYTALAAHQPSPAQPCSAPARPVATEAPPARTTRTVRFPAHLTT